MHAHVYRPSYILYIPGNERCSSTSLSLLCVKFLEVSFCFRENLFRLSILIPEVTRIVLLDGFHCMHADISPIQPALRLGTLTARQQVRTAETRLISLLSYTLANVHLWNCNKHLHLSIIRQ